MFNGTTSSETTSSGTTAPLPLPAKPQPKLPSCEAFIEERLRRTRRQVKGVDIAGGLVVLVIGVLAYLLAAAMIDHWVISGGLGFWGRLLLLTGLLGGAGYYFARRILMPLIHRINPIFAAYTIEQSRPSLKNSLINFLLLRGHSREVSQPVYRAIEHRAAADLSQIEIEVAVDRTHVIRLGYVLVGTLAVCCLYLVLSPKSPLTSAARVLWPWSGTAAPTRVTIEDVKPGNTTAFHGDFVTVSAEVDGVGEGEAVALYYSTADGQTVNQKIPMTRPENGFRHQCTLPAEEIGLQQRVYYYLTAGDYTTRPFTVDVQTAPTILVDSVEYDYPAYTGFSRRAVKRRGDVRAIEGTRVTIRAAANRAIHWAKIDLGCNGLHEIPMRATGETAAGSFTLQLDPNDPTLPEHDSYQLRFRDDAGRLNPQPIRHRIEVVRDLPPEIQLVSPRLEDVQLAENGRLLITVRAEDPDFALEKVVLRAESDGRTLIISPMLVKPHQGEFQDAYLFEPARARFESDPSAPSAAGLKAGDRVRYWAEAEDNKQPTPGRGTTAQQWITIVKPSTRQPPQEQPGGTGQEQTPQPAQDVNDQPQEEQPRQPAPEPREDGSQEQDRQDDASGQQEPGPQEGTEQQENSAQPGDGSEASESGSAGQQQGQPSDEAPEPIDPETQPGDAIEKILEHRQQQQQEQGEQETGEPKAGEPKAGEQKAGEQKAGEQKAGEQEAGEQKTGEQKTGEQKAGEQQPPEEGSPGSGEPSGEKTGSPSPQGQNRDREKQPGEAGRNPGEEEQQADSPSISPHQSDSPQGETSGDRSGQGEKGGGQRSDQQGAGAAGSHTEADDGGSAGKQQGDGQTGSRGGNQIETDQQTGSSETRRGEPGSEARRQPGEVGSEELEGEGNDSGGAEKPLEQPREGGQMGKGAASGPHGQRPGNPMVGGGQGERPDTAPTPETGKPGGDDPNLEFAREATDLALEHLRDQMDQGDTDLLDRLGWTREDARKFLQKWQQWKRAAAQPGTEGEAARSRLDGVLKSLGLRPRGTQIEGDATRADRLQNLRDAGRFDPPGDWSERFRAYRRGVAGGGSR